MDPPKQQVVMPTQVTNAAGEHPFSNDVIVFRGELFNKDNIIRKFTHCNRVGIVFPIIIKSFLPSPINTTFPNEHQ